MAATAVVIPFHVMYSSSADEVRSGRHVYKKPYLSDLSPSIVGSCSSLAVAARDATRLEILVFFYYTNLSLLNASKRMATAAAMAAALAPPATVGATPANRRSSSTTSNRSRGSRRGSRRDMSRALVFFYTGQPRHAHTTNASSTSSSTSGGSNGARNSSSCFNVFSYILITVSYVLIKVNMYLKFLQKS